MKECYIDMHCHILPGVDDGAKDLAETKKMLEIAYAEGIRCIIATPHHHRTAERRRQRSSVKGQSLCAKQHTRSMNASGYTLERKSISDRMLQIN